MPTEVKVPPLGESVVEATVGAWHRKEGDHVAAGDALVSLETEKVAVEVTSTISGVLEKLLAHEGDTVRVGQPLAEVTEGDGPADAATAASGKGASTRIEQTSPGAPEPEEEGSEEEAPSPTASAPSSPSARRAAAEQGVDLGGVRGSGPSGRIRREDVHPPAPPAASTPPPPSPRPSASPSPALSPSLPPSASPAPTPQPAADNTREERVRLSRRRLTIARRLVEAQQTAAMLTTFNDIDLSAVMAVRVRRKSAFQERHGVNLGFMSFFTRAVVGALKAFPPLNSELQGDILVLKHHYDIGVAVATDEGLVVPVIRDADRKSFAEIEREIGDVARRARENKLTLEDLLGGTFTITNGGTFGSMLSTPILNPPQVGILGMHRIQDRPVAVDGQVVIRPMMYVALTYDHRVVDGKEAVQFLVRVKELIEDPERLLLEG